MIGFQQRLTAGRCICLLATVACVVVSLNVVWAAESGPPAIVRTIAKGLNYRASLPQTFEGYLTMIRFHGPASDRSAGGAQLFPNVANIRLQVMDRARDAWLSERRWYYGPEDPGAARVTHTVTVRRQGIYATKSVEQNTWRTMSDYSVGEEEFLQECLMVVRMSDKSTALRGHSRVTEVEFEGAKCLYLQAFEESPRNPRLVTYIFAWIEPDKGFAVRKWILVVTLDGQVRSSHSFRARDLREYAPGFWLPRRVQSVRCLVPEGQSVPVLDKLTIWEILEAKVNQPLSEDFWAPLAFDDEYPTTPYEPRLADDTLVEIEVAEAEGAPVEDDSEEPVRKEVKLKEIIDRLLKELAEGPGDPASFMEPLPELPGTFQ